MKIDPRHILGPTTDPAKVETIRPRPTSASKSDPPSGADRVSLSSDVQLAQAAMKAATQADDVRLEEVARATALYERGEVGNDLENLASKILDSLVKSEP